MERPITINVFPPVDCTEEQFREWCEYRLGLKGSINLDNPLHEYDLEVTSLSI